MNNEILMNMILSLQSKIRQLEERMDDLENNVVDSMASFGTATLTPSTLPMSTRENAFCADDFIGASIETTTLNAHKLPLNAGYFRLE